MKKLLLLASVLAAVGTMAQGLVDFRNRNVGVDVPVTDKVSGAKVGDAYYAAFYWGASKDSLTAAVVGAAPGTYYKTALRNNAQGPTGYFADTGLTVLGLNPGDVVWAQVKVWSANGGNTFEAAEAKGASDAAVKLGVSNFFQVAAGGNIPGKPPATAGTLAGLVGPFTVDSVVIPEPSILALGLLGGVAFLLRRRS